MQASLSENEWLLIFIQNGFKYLDLFYARGVGCARNKAIKDWHGE